MQYHYAKAIKENGKEVECKVIAHFEIENGKLLSCNELTHLVKGGLEDKDIYWI